MLVVMTSSTYPFEVWRYRYIEGVGQNIELEFVDPTLTGEYRLTMDPSEKDALLHIPGARAALCAANVPIVAVSPIVGGTAIKGPTAKMMRELKVPASADQVAHHSGDLLTGMVLDEQDRDLHGTLNTTTTVAQTVMVTLRDRVDLARTVLEFIVNLARKRLIG